MQLESLTNSKRLDKLRDLVIIPLLFVILGYGGGEAMAVDSRIAYLPMTFHSEAGPVRTSACLKVNERVYPKSFRLEDFKGSSDKSEIALAAVIDAIKQKNRNSLFALSDPRFGRDAKRFEEQAGAFFQQFNILEFVSVNRSFEFDGLIVFFVELEAQGRRIYAPFLFARQENTSVGFLPYRTEALTYRMVSDWFNSSWGPSATENPIFCSDADIKRATHRVGLASSPIQSNPGWHPSYLMLTGIALDKPSVHSKLVGQVKSTISDMQNTLDGDNLRGFTSFLTPEGGTRLKGWFASADQAEISKYKASIKKVKPFFMFVETPLIVVFSRTPDMGVQVMYFTFTSNDQLLWTNSSHITISDQIFKKEALYNAASTKNPFDGLSIR